MINKYLLLILFLIPTSIIVADDEPSSGEIEKKISSQSGELDALRNQIMELEKSLDLRKREADNVEHLIDDLEIKMDLTEKLIRSLNREELLINSRILYTGEIIRKKEQELLLLRRNLVEQVRTLYKYGMSTPVQDFISNKDINQSFYKQKYLQVVLETERQVSGRIDTLLTELHNEKLMYESDLVQKKEILSENESENIKLEKDRQLRKNMLVQIRNDEKLISWKLEEKRELAIKIEQMIKELIDDKQKALKREQKLARIRKEKKRLGDNYFVTMKGQLAWPVEGKIVEQFGLRYNEQTKTWIENPGIDIQSAPGSEVVPVMDGMISTITYLRGYGNVVIIDHGGKYYTVYGNVEKILVKENDYVDEKTSFAVVGENDGIISNLHFEVWGNLKKLDPEIWLK